jgi:phosphoglycolate phosphatase-like HAD superfamily hydrolase
MAMKYIDIDAGKTAFIFELDNVIYPEKDFLYQVYYLFASVLEYVELINAKDVTDLMVNTYIAYGNVAVYEAVKQKFGINEKYRGNLQHLFNTAKLPLKLLVYQNVLDLMQQIIVDRKQLFIVTNGNPAQQLNKIKQTEWHGLEPYLTCYFAEEIKAKPEPDTVDLLIRDHKLQRKDLLMIGNSEADSFCAEACGIDYLNVNEIL